MTGTASTLGTWFHALHAELCQRGLDANSLFQDAGVNPAALGEPQARIPLARSRALWQAAVTATNDPALGLAVARQIRQTTFSALGYAVLASTTLEDALRRIVRYFRVVSDAAELRLDECPTTFRLQISPLPGPTQPAEESIDAMLAVLANTCRALSGKTFKPSGACLRRARPPNIEPYIRTFGDAVQFGAAETALYVDKPLAQQALPYGNDEIARHNDVLLQKLLSSYAPETLVSRLRSVLIPQLSTGAVSQDWAARALHMSSRNLQRHLQHEKTTFREVLDELRRDLAMEHMHNPCYRISEVAWLLGFGDSGSFSRSFRRWTGTSPREWRAKQKDPSTAS